MGQKCGLAIFIIERQDGDLGLFSIMGEECGVDVLITERYYVDFSVL
jgi:hypothetical protein